MPDGRPIVAFKTYKAAQKAKVTNARMAAKIYGPFLGNRKLWEIHPLILR